MGNGSLSEDSYVAFALTDNNNNNNNNNNKTK